MRWKLQTRQNYNAQHKQKIHSAKINVNLNFVLNAYEMHNETEIIHNGEIIFFNSNVCLVIKYFTNNQLEAF